METQRKKDQTETQQTLENKKEKKAKKKLTKKQKFIFLFSILGVLLLLFLFSIIFALFNVGNDKILSKISINEMDVSNLSKQEALDRIKEVTDQRIEKDISLTYHEYETSISPKQLEVSYNVEEAIQEAYEYGRNGNIFINNYQILKTKLVPKKVVIAINLNQEELEKQLEDINSKIPNSVTESSYYVEEDELIITKGKEGLAIEKEEIKKQIYEKLSDLKQTDKAIEISTQTKRPEAIDLDKIYQEIHREPQNAYYTTEPFKLYPHVDGIDFAISLEEAKEKLKEEKEEYSIPLKITKPEITTDKLGSKAFPDLLSTFSTKYDASNTARSKNLALAAAKINGTVVMPGEIFSYNKVVGERTIAAGYQEAKIYENGKVVDGLGGGICQISSTLYNTVVYANLDIVSRRNHQFLTSYVGAGKDATVVYGSTDFKFRNTRTYPIKLVCSVKNGIAKIDMYGIKEEKEYKVEIKTTVTSTIPYTTSYTEDASMEAGKEVVKQKGMNGCKSETYKVLSLNGKVVSRTLLSKDTYNPMQRLVIKGTKSAATKPPVVEEPTVPEKPEEPVSNTQSENETQTNTNVNQTTP